MNEALFTLREAAAKTRMTESWWRAAIYQKRIRYVKIGRRVFIPDSTIEKLLSGGIVEPVGAKS